MLGAPNYRTKPPLLWLPACSLVGMHPSVHLNQPCHKPDRKKLTVRNYAAVMWQKRFHHLGRNLLSSKPSAIPYFRIVQVRAKRNTMRRFILVTIHVVRIKRESERAVEIGQKYRTLIFYHLTTFQRLYSLNDK